MFKLLFLWALCAYEIDPKHTLSICGLLREITQINNVKGSNIRWKLLNPFLFLFLKFLYTRNSFQTFKLLTSFINLFSRLYYCSSILNYSHYIFMCMYPMKFRYWIRRLSRQVRFSEKWSLLMALIFPSHRTFKRSFFSYINWYP